jgi:hypothetical protein
MRSPRVNVSASLFARVGELPRWLTPKRTFVLTPLEVGGKSVEVERTVTATLLTLGAVTDAEISAVSVP